MSVHHVPDLGKVARFHRGRSVDKPQIQRTDLPHVLRTKKLKLNRPGMNRPGIRVHCGIQWTSQMRIGHRE